MRRINHSSRFIEECYSRYPKQKLGGHISVIRGVSYKPSDVRSSVDEEVAIILRSNNIADGEINFDDLVYVVQERVQNEQKLKPGDIVMCGSNGSISLVGKAGLLKDNMPNTAFGAFCLGIKCKETILPEYLNTYFNTQVYRNEIESMGNGTNIINIRPDNITNLFIPIPPVEKQMAFVEVVNQADKSKFSDFKSRFIEMFGDTLKNTKDWEFRRLPEVTTIVLGSTPSSSYPDYWDGSVKWITPAELDDNSFILTDSERHITVDGVRNAGLKSFPAGTVIFSTRAPIGKTAIAGCEMYCNQGFKNFICSKKLNPIYLFYTLRSHKEELQKMGTGSTFLELSKKTIENISVSVPERSLQDEFEVVYRQADKSNYLN